MTDVIKDLQERSPGEYVSLEIVSEIAHVREVKGITQRQLSEMSGVPQKTISRLENGKDFPTLDTLGKLMKALKITPKITFDR